MAERIGWREGRSKAQTPLHGVPPRAPFPCPRRRRHVCGVEPQATDGSASAQRFSARQGRVASARGSNRSSMTIDRRDHSFVRADGTQTRDVADSRRRARVEKVSRTGA
jgi:hypothetical protein